VCSDLTPGEFSTATDAQYNKAQNEKLYTQLFGAALKTAGHPNHAIVDTGRYVPLPSHPPSLL
jgi:cellulose 1,4-beta-cellobiosidase